MNPTRFFTLCGSVIPALLLTALAVAAAHAAETPPRASYLHRSLLIRSGNAYWGLDAPTATFAAQIQVESRWRSDAVSPVGARGMAQFMPATARWIADLYPHLADNTPGNPAWALPALVTYNKYHFDRVRAVDRCNRMAKALAAYNGGLGWVQKDEKAAARKGLDPARYFGGVEDANGGRRAAAKRETYNYVRRILLTYEREYEAAGFGEGVCP